MQIDLKKISHILLFVVLLPFVSLLLSWLFFKVFPNPPFWLETVSPLGVYGGLCWLFDNKIWHHKIFKFLGVIDFPDLRGRWEGVQKSTYKQNGESVQSAACLEISQTFSKIFIRAYYERSQSESIVADFKEVNGETYLFYSYDNEPNSMGLDTMKNHKGTVKLKYLYGDGKLRGSYFNSIGNRGDIELQRVEIGTFPKVSG